MNDPMVPRLELKDGLECRNTRRWLAWSWHYKPNDRLPVRMILLDEKDVIAVTWQCSRIRCSGNQNPSLGPPQILPSTQPLSKKLDGKKLPEQERRAGWPGWFVLITLRRTTRFWGPRRSFNFYQWSLTWPTRGPPAPFAARGSSSLTSWHGPRYLGLPRATPRNRVPSGTAEVVREPSRESIRTSWIRSFRKAVNSALENVSFMAVITSDSDLHRPASSDSLPVCNRSTVFAWEHVGGASWPSDIVPNRSTCGPLEKQKTLVGARPTS